MKRYLNFLCQAAIAALVTISMPALATPGGEGNNTGCNGVGNPNSPCAGGGGQGGTGGAGGAGGLGGTGVGVGVGVGIGVSSSNSSATGGNASVVGSGNSTVRNNNANVQGQQQGQSQSSRNTNRNNNQSSATGGAGGQASATGGSSGGNTLSNGVNVEGDKGDVYVAPAQERNPVATAYAAPLTSSPETCMGSSSGGVQGGAIGISIATTWESVKCDRRMFARALDAVGMRSAAVAMLCLDTDVAAAMKNAGSECPNVPGKRADATSTKVSDIAAPNANRYSSDPLIA